MSVTGEAQRQVGSWEGRKQVKAMNFDSKIFLGLGYLRPNVL